MQITFPQMAWTLMVHTVNVCVRVRAYASTSHNLHIKRKMEMKIDNTAFSHT